MFYITGNGKTETARAEIAGCKVVVRFWSKPPYGGQTLWLITITGYNGLICETETKCAERIEAASEYALYKTSRHVDNLWTEMARAYSQSTRGCALFDTAKHVTRAED